MVATALTANAIVGTSYQVVRPLGRGGMGEVLEVRHLRTGASYALKVLSEEFSGNRELLARFQREAETTSRLNHPNLVRVFDFDRMEDGRPYLVMELLQGMELAQVIANAGGRLPVARVVNIVEQVAMGLAAAHESGVIHRDLKPANVFVTPLPGTKRELVRILDFGISKVRNANTNLTRTATIMGTPHYMSPEQAMGKNQEIDASTDGWALAVMTFEMLTGRLPFDSSEGPLSVLMHVVSRDPATFEELGVGIGPNIEAVIRKALSKDPVNRFRPITAFSRALARAAGPTATERESDEPALEHAEPDGRRAQQSLPVVPPTTTLRGSSGEQIVSDSETFSVNPRPIDDGASIVGRRSRRLVWVGTGVVAAAIIAFVALPSAGWTPGASGDPTPKPTVSAGGVDMLTEIAGPAPVPATNMAGSFPDSGAEVPVDSITEPNPDDHPISPVPVDTKSRRPRANRKVTAKIPAEAAATPRIEVSGSVDEPAPPTGVQPSAAPAPPARKALVF